MTSLLPLLLSLISHSSANELPDLVEEHENSSINWTKMRLQGKGTLPLSETESYSKQEVQALTFANEALLDSFTHFYIDAETQIEDTYQDEPKSKRYIQDNKRKYQVAETIYQTAEKVEVSVYLELQTLLRPIILSKTSIKDNPPYPSSHTGIIVDARNIDFQPVLFPTINKEEQAWLNITQFSEDSAKTTMPFIYATTAAHPAVVERVGRNPAIYRAKSAYKDIIQLDETIDPKLSHQDAKTLLAYGTVVILLDQP